jgi:hypothetical protein
LAIGERTGEGFATMPLIMKDGKIYESTLEWLAE